MPSVRTKARKGGGRECFWQLPLKPRSTNTPEAKEHKGLLGIRERKTEENQTEINISVNYSVMCEGKNLKYVYMLKVFVIILHTQTLSLSFISETQKCVQICTLLNMVSHSY